MGEIIINNHHLLKEDRTLIIGLVAGEMSGDILGSRLIRALKEQVSNIRFVGVCGPLMQAEGCEAWYEIEELAVMGIAEVFGRLLHLLRVRDDLTRRFIKLHPDAFIGIDAPDFNITLEVKLKKAGIKTIHYVSPSIWAWRQNRIFKIRKATELVLALLPFEKKIYDRHNIPCRFIGHTMADTIPLYPDKRAVRARLNISNDAKYLAILPGSRRSEVEMLTPDFLHAAIILVKKNPQLQILVSIANQELRQKFEIIYKNISPNLPIRILDGQSQLVMMAADVTLLASGTASLECMLAKCPMVVGYRMKTITYWLAKRLVKIPFISLPNLLASEALVEEFIQQDCQAEILADSIKSLLSDEKKVKILKQRFLQLHQSIRCYADKQAAEAVLEITKSQ